MTKPTADLANLLARLDRLLKENDPGLHSELKPPASPADLAALSRGVFAGAALPADVDTWFRWHDGQEGFTPLLHEDNRTLIACKEALRVWTDAKENEEDTRQPWSRTWLPLFENGAGDYICLETAGPGAGVLIEYWHDDDDRGMYFPSLSEWAAEVHEIRSRLYRPDPSGWVRVEIDWEKSPFEPVPCPTERDVIDAPVWTTFDILCPGDLGFEEYHRAGVKVAAGKWVYADDTVRSGVLADLKRKVEEIRRLDDPMLSLHDDLRYAIGVESSSKNPRASVYRARARATPQASA